MYRMAPVRTSYVISTRNRAEYLEQTLQNVREFLGPEDELIVVDGGSTDATAAVIDRYRRVVTKFSSEFDCGEAHGLNRGMLMASGRLIKVLTDDDYVYPEAMRRAVAVMDDDGSLDAVLGGGELCRIDPETGQCRVVAYSRLPQGHSLRGGVREVFHYVGCGLGLLLRRSALARVGLFDTSFRAIDTEYLARLVTSRINCRYLDVKLYRHITRPHSGVNSRQAMIRDFLRVLLRAGEWELAMDRSLFPAAAVAGVLGLSTVPFGGSVMELVDRAERLRRTRRPRALAGLVRATSLYERVLAMASQVKSAPAGLWRRIGARRSHASGHEAGATEPSWDGSLR